MRRLNVNLDAVLKPGKPAVLRLREDGEYHDSDTVTAPGVREYGSRILRVLTEKIVVPCPTELEAENSIDVGDEVTLELKFDRGVLRLDSKVVAKDSSPLPLLHIAHSDYWSHSQHRENVRLAVALSRIEIAVVSEGHGEEKAGGTAVATTGTEWLKNTNVPGQPVKAIARDLSAGGLQLASEIRLEAGAIIKARFALDQRRPEITALTRVVWVEEDESAQKYRYRVGCRFLNLDRKSQDHITKFIFDRQLELRRRGLL